jgi:hypothetical protein
MSGAPVDAADFAPGCGASGVYPVAFVALHFKRQQLAAVMLRNPYI